MSAILALFLLSDTRVLDYCDRITQLAAGLGPCTVVDDIAALVDVEELNFCCGWDGSPCVEVAVGDLCDDAHYMVICEWGRVLTDGTIECFDEW